MPESIMFITYWILMIFRYVENQQALYGCSFATMPEQLGFDIATIGDSKKTRIVLVSLSGNCLHWGTWL
jgi:hypothetical protein